MDKQEFLDQLGRNLDGLADWKSQWPEFEQDETQSVDPERVASVMGTLVERLRDNYPFHHPRYAGQMLKPPHPVAMLAYATAMQINPNNHALDGGAATSHMEREVVADLARMVGFRDQHLGHLTASGTIANLEALWIARSLHPDKAIAISDQAHYTHGRACELLRVETVVIPTDSRGKMHLGELDRAMAVGNIGTIVATLGSTAMGALDPLDQLIPTARDAGARVHVDAAYGGFFALLAASPEPIIPAAPYLALAGADSVVIDPHKHGLQPYGCGAVLFRDPSVGTFYKHDSPYTYFTSDELHLGEISLECSRAGASAAALWATLQCLPLESDTGLGPVLAKSRQAAIEWAVLIDNNARLRLVAEPELDIVTFYALPGGEGRPRASQISKLTQKLFEHTMNEPDDPLYLATLSVTDSQLAGRDPSIIWDRPTVSVLRSVVMKPEHLAAIPDIHATVLRHLNESEE
jgi:glutamate/tyrosine decarboxylase-like PLP-dependent enzyme